MMTRDFQGCDADQVNQVALAAFEQLKSHYDDWSAMSAGLARMSDLSNSGEIIVAENGNQVVGAVAYIPPNQAKADYFDPTWPVIRMLVVAPAHCGLGAGRALTKACIERARRDGAPVIALHTSPIMTVALPLYLRMGFELLRPAPPICGVQYSVYLKDLSASG
jgi:predicted N-acetyltransferase YhbS